MSIMFDSAGWWVTYPWTTTVSSLLRHFALFIMLCTARAACTTRSIFTTNVCKWKSWVKVSVAALTKSPCSWIDRSKFSHNWYLSLRTWSRTVKCRRIQSTGRWRWRQNFFYLPLALESWHPRFLCQLFRARMSMCDSQLQASVSKNINHWSHHCQIDSESHSETRFFGRQSFNNIASKHMKGTSQKLIISPIKLIKIRLCIIRLLIWALLNAHITAWTTTFNEWWQIYNR